MRYYTVFLLRAFRAWRGMYVDILKYGVTLFTVDLLFPSIFKRLVEWKPNFINKDIQKQETFYKDAVQWS